MDSIARRPQRRNRRDGMYIARFDFGPKDGRRVRQTRKFPTKEARDLWLAECRKQRRAGFGPQPDLTVGDVLRRWRDEQDLKGAHQLRERTRIEYDRYLARHLLPRLGDVPAHGLEAQEAVRGLVLDWKRGGAGDLRSTHQHALDVLRMAYRWAAGPGRLVMRNPLLDLALPQAARPRRDPPATWKDDESVRLFIGEALRSRPPYPFVYLLAFYHGMRQGEILGLEWAQVDLYGDPPTLRVVQTLSHLPGRWVFGPPKTEAGRRTIAIDPEVRTGLLEQKRAQGIAKRELGPRYGVPGHPGRDLVFSHPDGRPIDARTFLRRQFYPLCRRAGMPPIHFHDLRHLWTTYFYAAGGSPRDAASILGHTDHRMAMEVYAHHVPEAQRRAMRVVADRLRGAGR